MAGVQLANNAVSTLAGSINTVVTAMSVQAGHGARFPAASIVSGNYFYVSIIDLANNIEIVKVTDRVTDTFTIIRARDGTTAQAFAANTRVELRPVAAMFNELPNRLLLNADLADNTIKPVKLETIAGLVAGSYGGAFKRPLMTVNAKGQLTTIADVSDTLTGTGAALIKFGGAAVGVTYSANPVFWVQVGGTVDFSFRITLTSKGSSVGVATVDLTAAGMPSFLTTLPGLWAANTCYMTGFATMAGHVMSLNNNLTLNLRQMGAAGVADITNANFTNTSDFAASGSYPTPV